MKTFEERTVIPDEKSYKPASTRGSSELGASPGITDKFFVILDDPQYKLTQHELSAVCEKQEYLQCPGLKFLKPRPPLPRPPLEFPSTPTGSETTIPSAATSVSSLSTAAASQIGFLASQPITEKVEGKSSAKLDQQKIETDSAVEWSTIQIQSVD